VEYTDRGHVGPGEDRGRRLWRVQKVQPGSVPGHDLKVAFTHQVGIEGQARPFQSAAVSGDPGVTAQEVGGSGDGADAAVPELEEVPRRRESAAPVVRPDDRHVLRKSPVHVDHHVGDRPDGQLGLLRGSELGGDHQHTERRAGKRRVQPLLRRAMLAAELRHDDAQTCRRCCRLDPADDLHRPGRPHPMKDEIDQAGLDLGGSESPPSIPMTPQRLLHA
jgi:hypothetical protein